jgi:hypothetical protein
MNIDGSDKPDRKSLQFLKPVPAVDCLLKPNHGATLFQLDSMPILDRLSDREDRSDKLGGCGCNEQRQ